MKTKVYKDYVEKYKSYDAGDYFYAKDELLNKLYGFDDRGEFAIEVLDEMINLQSRIDKAIEYIKPKFIEQGGLTSYEVNDLLNELLNILQGSDKDK